MRKRLVLSIVLLIVVFVVTGCSDAAPVIAPTPTPSPTLRTVPFSKDLDSLVVSVAAKVDTETGLPLRFAVIIQDPNDVNWERLYSFKVVEYNQPAGWINTRIEDGWDEPDQYLYQTKDEWGAGVCALFLGSTDKGYLEINVAEVGVLVCKLSNPSYFKRQEG